MDQLRTLVTRNIAKFTTSIFEILVTVAFMVAISWQLTLIALVVLPAMFVVWLPLLRKLRRGDRRVLDLAGDVASHMQETVFGIRQVKASAAERFESERFREPDAAATTRLYVRDRARCARSPARSPRRSARDRYRAAALVRRATRARGTS